MEKLPLHSPDLTQHNIERIAELFPTVVTESRDVDGNVVRTVDFDLLRQELSGHIVDGPQERYQVDWPGKREALFAANAPVAKTLRPVREESVDFDITKNLFIEGDNLDALKLLQESYLGKVKLIYIDPPYNTGNDFIYDDDFAETTQEYLARSGQVDDSGVRLVANTEANGRFHSDWLSMMYPRLKLARSLLTEDGAVFVSCDEGEQPRLRQVMDEIFGSRNFVSDMVWAAGRKNDSRFISVSHEYIVCYVRDKSNLIESNVHWRQRKKGLDDIYAQYDRLKRDLGQDYAAITAGMKRWYKGLQDTNPAKAHKHFSHVDARGIYFPDNISWPGGGGPKYEVLHPITRRPVKVPSRGWMTSDPEKMKTWIAEGRVHFGEDETSVPCIKSYLTDHEYQTPYSVFYQDGRAASKRLRALLGGDYFDFPKDERMLQEIVAMVTGDRDLVLDLFAGTGPLAHATWAQNTLDGARREWISVQIAEPCDPSTRSGKTALDAGFRTIAAVARLRLRRAAAEIEAAFAVSGGSSHPDLGWRTMRLASSNMSNVLRTPDGLAQDHLAGFTDAIKPGRTGEDLLFQVLIDWGLELSMFISRETIDGFEVFVVEDGALIACFDEGITMDLVRAIAARQPLRAVFRDSGFATDADRINTEQIFRELSPSTDVKTI